MTRTPPARGTRARVLVVDDDEALCATIREALEPDCAVFAARHGAAALELARVEQPDLVLLDLRMPIMDGWSFVEQYRRIAARPGPIVVMSAATDLPRIAGQLGAEDHLRKPFSLPELVRTVERHLAAPGAPGVSAG